MGSHCIERGRIRVGGKRDDPACPAEMFQSAFSGGAALFHQQTAQLFYRIIVGSSTFPHARIIPHLLIGVRAPVFATGLGSKTGQAFGLFTDGIFKYTSQFFSQDGAVEVVMQVLPPA